MKGKGNIGFILWPSGSGSNDANTQRVLQEMTVKYGQPTNCSDANTSLQFLQSEIVRMQGDSSSSTGWYRSAYQAIIPQLQAYIQANCQTTTIDPTTGGGGTQTPTNTPGSGSGGNNSSWLLAIVIAGGGIYLATRKKGNKKSFI